MTDDTRIHIEFTFTRGPAWQELMDFAKQVEAERYDDALKQATEAGYGLRVDIYDWETKYYIDKDLSAGMVTEHRLKGDPPE